MNADEIADAIASEWYANHPYNCECKECRETQLRNILIKAGMDVEQAAFVSKRVIYEE